MTAEELTGIKKIAVDRSDDASAEYWPDVALKLIDEIERLRNEYKRGVMESAALAKEYWSNTVEVDTAPHTVEVEIWQELLGYDKWEKKFKAEALGR